MDYGGTPGAPMDDTGTDAESFDPVRILIADDHELVRRGLTSILTRDHPEWQLVAEASNGARAIELGLELRPNVAILDISMPDRTGLDAAQTLLEAIPGIRIVILTMHAAMPVLRHLKKVGVSAYLVKNEAPRKLVEAIERTLRGEPFFASEAAGRSINELDPAEYVPAQFLLTMRELDVMRELARGKSNKQVAADLGMSVRTAETHRANVLLKLGAHSLGELVRIAIRDQVVEAG